MLKTTSLLRRRILAAANRMMSTHRVPFSFSSPRSPWMLLEPRLCETSGGAIFSFWCFAEEKEYVFHDAKKNSRDAGGNLGALDMQLLGSSPGWVACRRPNGNIYLLDPVSYDAVDLPPWIDNHSKLKTLVFAESERKAFVIFGAGRSLAFCSTSTRDEWTPFGGDEYYESMSYSTAHRRLLCITSALKLEAWDVGHDSPRLDWVAHLYSADPLRFDVKFLACEEQSGQLFVVVGHQPNFMVFRIEDQRWLIQMMHSLEGMAFFVGNKDQAIALRDVGPGVEPNSVYFTCDSRFKYNSFVGYYDYLEKSTDYVSCPLPKRRRGRYPVWFTPHPRHIIMP